MQAVILAAGKSKRFIPFTDIGHKTCVKLLGKTILEHTLESVKKAGITDVILVTSPDTRIKQIVQNNKNTGLNIQFVTQHEANGQGDGLIQAKPYLNKDFFLLNASHLELHEFAGLMKKKKKSDNEIVLLAKEETRLFKFGIIRHEGDRVKEIVEKPEKGKEPSNLKVIGIYLLNKQFLETLAETQRFQPDHYSLEIAISNYAQTNICTFTTTDKPTISLKFAWDLLEINKYLYRNIKSYVSTNSSIAKNVVITGNVIIEDGVKIYEGACIKGPCYIGKNSIIGNNALIRDTVSVGENCVIGANTEIRNSIIFSNTNTHSGFIGDSIIGENCRIAAYFCTANRRLDRNEIKVKVNEEKITSGLNSLGVIMGNNIKVGIHSSTMPGIIIGRNTLIGPATIVDQNIEEDTKYYTEFKQIIKKNK